MIQINKRYAIKPNKSAVALCKSYMVKGKKEWREVGYYNDIPGALDKLSHLAVLRGIDQGSWEAVISELEQLRVEISAIRDALQVEV